MASVGDVIRIRGCQELVGQSLCNIFYYLVAVWTGNASLEDVLIRFTSDVAEEIASVQTDDLEWVGIFIDNMNDPDEFSENGVSFFGQAVAESMPQYVAAGVQLVRTTKATRHGAKRIAGIGEDQWLDGAFTPSVGLIQSLQDACEHVLVKNVGGTNEMTLVPVIVGTGIDGRPDPAITNIVRSAFLRRGTTQNSRKIR